MKRKKFAVIAVVFTSAYLLIGRGQWFADLERQASVGKDVLYSQPLDLSRRGTTTWEIPRNKWSYVEGEAQLALVLDVVPNLPPQALNRSELPLRVKVTAIGATKKGMVFDRLIHNWYYTTNEPFDPEVRLWSSGSSNRIEYGIAGIVIYPFEDTIVSLDVTTPDPSLSIGNPRLKLVGQHDYAVFGHLPLLRVLRDSGLIVALLMILGLAYLALNPTLQRHEP